MPHSKHASFVALDRGPGWPRAPSHYVVSEGDEYLRLIDMLCLPLRCYWETVLQLRPDKPVNHENRNKGGHLHERHG